MTEAQRYIVKYLLDTGDTSLDDILSEVQCAANDLRQSGLIADDDDPNEISLTEKGLESARSMSKDAQCSLTLPYLGYETRLKEVRQTVRAIQDEGRNRRCIHVQTQGDYVLSCLTNLEEAMRAERDDVRRYADEFRQAEEMAVCEGAAIIHNRIAEDCEKEEKESCQN